MKRSALALATAAAAAVTTTGPAALAQSVIETSVGPLLVETVASGLDEPWSVGFLPGGGILVTERAGRLLRIDAEGARAEIDGVPQVFAQGQGGLLDVLVPRDFEESRQVYLTFATPQDTGAHTALGVGRLAEDRLALLEFEVIFEAQAGWSGGQHFGSRLAEGPEGHIFMSVGERGDMDSAQDRTNHNGTILRLNRDGTPAADNPFAGTGDAQPEIWSWGHRNPQGLAVAPDGRLWAAEHGPQGGDELNLVEPGLNYGWPEIGESRHYDGTPMRQGTEAEGMERPVASWTPALAPSGLAAYSGALWPEWEGHLFLGSLQQDRIVRVDPMNPEAEESLQSPETTRVRDVREGPDGALWFLSVGSGALFRIAPATE